MSDISFHRLEAYGYLKGGHLQHNRYVRCSFETERFGYYQVDYADKKLQGLVNEPDINAFTQEDQRRIERLCAIVYRMVYDVPAMKDRFA